MENNSMSQLPIYDPETNNIIVCQYREVTIGWNQFNRHQWNGHEYELIPIDRKWLEASADCEILGGHLVTIATEEENNFVASLVSEAQIVEVLIGFTDQDTEGEWQWITNEPVTYTNWDPGEPADAGQEDYAGIRNDGRWPDLQVYEERPYVCEWDTINGTLTTLTLEEESTDLSSTSMATQKIAPFLNLSTFLPLLQRVSILFFIITLLIVIRRYRPK
jgi:hypothetical protein